MSPRGLLLNLRYLKYTGGFILEKNEQSIIPVTLHDDQTDRQHISKVLSQKMVAHLKNSQTELLIYEGIKPSTLRVLLAEMPFNETR